MRPPPLAVIVKLYVPVGEFLLVFRVIVEFPEPVTEVGLKDALVRFGNPLTLRLTLEVNGPIGVTVTV